MPSLNLHGLTFEANPSQWEVIRKFSFFAPVASKNFNELAPCVRGLAIEYRKGLPQSEPSRAQVAALGFLLDHEEAICRNVMDAVLRWQKEARKSRRDAFEDCPRVRSVTGLGEIVELTDVRITDVELDGVALVTVGFNCEWDVEHGFGLIVWKDTVLDEFQEEITVFRSGVFSRVCNDAEREARERFFAVYETAAPQLVMADDVHDKLQREVDRRIAWERVAAQKELPELLADLRGGGAGVASWNARNLLQRIGGGPYKKLNLSGAILDGVSFEDQAFPQCNFDGASFVGANFVRTDLKRATFRGAKLPAVKTCLTKFDGCDFSEATLSTGTFLLRCSTSFFQCSLKKAVFHGVDLSLVGFTSCKIQGADFSQARLNGDCSWRSNEFDQNTKFPPGFQLPDAYCLKWKGQGADPRST